MTITELRELVLSKAEAAETLDTSLFTIEKYRRRGWLVPITDRRSGRALVYSASDVEKLKRKLANDELFRAKPGPRRKGPWRRPWKLGKQTV